MYFTENKCKEQDNTSGGHNSPKRSKYFSINSTIRTKGINHMIFALYFHGALLKTDKIEKFLDQLMEEAILSAANDFDNSIGEICSASTNSEVLSTATS